MRGIIIFTIYSSIVLLRIECMNHDLIKSSDGHLYSIPQHIIDFSNVLVEKQLLKQKLNIKKTQSIYVSINKNNLDLFFKACNVTCDTNDSFDLFFDSLSSENKSLLTLLTDKNKLNSPIIIIKILSSYGLTSIIKPYLEIDTIENYFYNKIVQNNIKTKTKNISNRNRRKFNNNYSIEFNETENFTIIPNCVIKNNKHIFNGHIQKIDAFRATKTFNKQENIIYATSTHKNNNDDKITYYLTDNTPNKKNQNNYLEKTRRLLICNAYEQIITTKVITHKNPIKKTMFSPDGHYLATYSQPSLYYPYHTLLITKLGIKKSDFHSIVIPFFNTITEFSFNPQSSILVTGSLSNNNALLQIWKPSKGKCVQTIDANAKKIEIIQFNTSGTRMLTTSSSTEGVGTYILWNTENPFIIVPIHDITLLDDKITKFPQFNNSKNILVLPTHKGCLIFINSINGEMISHSKAHQHLYSDKITNIIFTPNNKFCIANTTLLHKKSQDTTSMWKINTGSFIGFLLSNKSNTRGIGLTPNLKYSVTTFNNRTMIKTELLDDHSIQFLMWLKKNSSLLQIYALYHTYKSYKQKEDPSPEILSLLQQFPTSPCNVKKIINFYLLQLPSFQKIKNHN